MRQVYSGDVANPPDDLTDEERVAVVTALREKIDGDRFPYSPRSKPFKSAPRKLVTPPAKTAPKPPIAGASEAAIRRRKRLKRE
jgi:hypothetical protein